LRFKVNQQTFNAKLTIDGYNGSPKLYLYSFTTNPNIPPLPGAGSAPTMVTGLYVVSLTPETQQYQLNAGTLYMLFATHSPFIGCDIYLENLNYQGVTPTGGQKFQFIDNNPPGGGTDIIITIEGTMGI
jgi:hypothetical protein